MISLKSFQAIRLLEYCYAKKAVLVEGDSDELIFQKTLHGKK